MGGDTDSPRREGSLLDWLALIALLISLVNGYFNLQNHRRQKRADRRADKAEQRADDMEARAEAAEQRALEQERPEFRVEIVPHTERGGAYIVARNIGGGPAMRLRGHLHGDPSRLLGMQATTMGPVRPNETFVFYAENSVFPLGGGTPEKLNQPGARDVVLRWEDKRGKPATQRFTQAEQIGREGVGDANPPTSWPTNHYGRPIE